MTDQWTQGQVKEVSANPVYAGIGSFPAIVNDELWVKAFIKLMGEIGVKKALALMLQELRKSFSQ